MSVVACVQTLLISNLSEKESVESARRLVSWELMYFTFLKIAYNPVNWPSGFDSKLYMCCEVI